MSGAALPARTCVRTDEKGEGLRGMWPSGSEKRESAPPLTEDRKVRVKKSRMGWWRGTKQDVTG